MELTDLRDDPQISSVRRSNDRLSITDFSEENLQHPLQMAMSVENKLDVPAAVAEKARQVLNERRGLLEQVAPHFIRVAEAVGSVYSDNFSDKIQGRRREGASTRYIYAGLLSMLPEQARSLWSDLPWNLTDERIQLLKVFGWSFNRMLMFRTDQHSDGHVDIKPRGSMDGRTLPYPMHTHIDVPFCMRSLGLIESTQSLALAAAHDALEEGLCFAVNGGSIAHGQVDLSSLVEKFPHHNLGENLIIGVPTLTESSFYEIAECIDGKLIAAHKEECFSIFQQSKFAETSNLAIDKYIFEHPLVFGGLALQIKEVVMRLVQTSVPENIELARDIIKVEIGDRISDMAVLERLAVSSFPNPNDRRLRICAYAFRMLNMLSKLKHALSVHPELQQQEFANTFALYPAILRVKFDELNSALQKQGLEPISVQFLSEMCERIFYPVQEAADRVMQVFVSDKVNSMLRAVSTKRFM